LLSPPRLNESANRLDQILDRRVVRIDSLRKFRHDACQLFTHDTRATEADECAHDLDVDRDRRATSQDAGKHRDSVLGERVRVMATATVY